jgi:hypothetical protein
VGGAPQLQAVPQAAAPPVQPPASVPAPPPPPLVMQPPVAPPPVMAPPAMAPPPPQPMMPPAPPAMPAWPTLAQQHAQVQREVTPVAPPPPATWQEREQQEDRERGDIARGLMAAMRRSEGPAAPLPPPSRGRSPYATSPSPAPPPPPIPIRPEADERFMPPAARSPLPGRLQDKLDLGMSREESVPAQLRGVLITVSVLATIMIMLVLMQRFGAIDIPFLRGAAGTHASSTDAPDGALLTPVQADPTAAIIDSLKREVESAKQEKAGVRPAVSVPQTPVPATRTRRTEPAATGVVPAPARSSGSEAAPSSGTSAPPSTSAPNDNVAQAAPPATTPPPAPVPTNFFGIGVVSYLDEGRARQEADRFTQSTKLPSVVMPYRDAGTTMYRVVIGRFTTVGEAERNANTLMENGVINEARVVTVPR